MTGEKRSVIKVGGMDKKIVGRGHLGALDAGAATSVVDGVDVDTRINDLAAETDGLCSLESLIDAIPATTCDTEIAISLPRSYQITLPKWWCRKHSFPEHVYVEEMDDGALRVVAG